MPAPYQKKSSAEARFRMSKENSRKTLETAITEKKIDPLMVPVSRAIAKTKNYFTTSTCSGRITLMELEENEKKRENAFYRKWHRPVKIGEVWEAIEKYSGKRNVWFKQDAFVFVIGTNTLEHAKNVFGICQSCGIKKYGIHHFEEGKVLVEVFGTHGMGAPIIEKGKLLVDKKYVGTLVKIANRKWKINDKKLQEFNHALMKGLK